jgi:putative DNA primase/helicase
MSPGSTLEEFEKRLGTSLLRGDTMINIDHIEHPLEGEAVNSALTQPMVQVRILGKSEAPTLPTSAFFTATGNNLQPNGDLVRRSVVGRLDPKCARPELRTYDFDPIAYAIENRPQLVCDILTLLKGYHNAGRPCRPSPLQSFVHWSNTVRGCICWLAETRPDTNLGDPVLTMERIRGSDPIPVRDS